MSKKLGSFGLFLILLLLGEKKAFAAEQSESAQQALRQLQIVQNRLKTASGDDDTTANTTTPRIPLTSEKKTTTTVVTKKATTVTTPSSAPSPENPPEIAISDDELIDAKAFEALIRQRFPLTPEQIVRLRQIFDTSEFAKASTAGTPPKPTATSQLVNLSPGSTPPVIRLAQGFVSSLVFLDMTGAPWPIAAYDLGDPSSFNIQWDKAGNTLMIQALKLYNYGNLAVRLKGLNTPVMLTLIPGQKAVDYRVDLRIPGVGPNAKTTTVIQTLPSSASDILLHVLEGVPPAGSQRLVISGGDARGWLFNEKMYIRTNLTILSPGWVESMTSADGMHAYEMQKSPVLLVSWHGKVMHLKVEGL